MVFPDVIQFVRREQCNVTIFDKGDSLLGNYQSDVEGGFDSWLVPAGESSASVRSLKEEAGGGKGQKVRPGV